MIAICLCFCVVITIYLYCTGTTSSGGFAMRDDGGTVQSIDWQGGCFVSVVLFGFLLAMLRSK